MQNNQIHASQSWSNYQDHPQTEENTTNQNEGETRVNAKIFIFIFAIFTFTFIAYNSSDYNHPVGFASHDAYDACNHFDTNSDFCTLMTSGDLDTGMLYERLNRANAGLCTPLNGPCIAISLIWDNKCRDATNDLDLWVTAPDHSRIGYSNKISCGGHLDVDRLEDCSHPVENIVWPGNAVNGNYTIEVNNFSDNHNIRKDYSVGLVIGGGNMEIFNGFADGNSDTHDMKFITSFVFDGNSEGSDDPFDDCAVAVVEEGIYVY